jgi:hypothetical protein
LILKQIMTPKARADIHVNLPALQKLDSMLIVGDLLIPKIEIHIHASCIEFSISDRTH